MEDTAGGLVEWKVNIEVYGEFGADFEV